jgi:DNA-binding SARP family transcriptional activator
MTTSKIAPASGRHLSSCDTLGADEAPLVVHLLGDLRVVVAGREVPMSSRRQRTLLALLASSPNRVVPTERLVDQLWDGAPPPGALVTLRSYISHIRRAISAGGSSELRLSTSDGGYRLEVDEDAIDVVRFRRLAVSAHQMLRGGDTHRAIAEFEQALGLWRGEPFVDLMDHEATVPLVVELSELRTGAMEGRLEALVETGRHVEAIPGLEALISDSPLRESPYELLMLALHRAGRSAEALELHRNYRALLRDELGIDPSARLDSLESAILNRDPRLDVPPHTSLRQKAVPADGPEPSVVALLTELVATLREVSHRTALAVELLVGQLPSGGAGDVAGELVTALESYADRGPDGSVTPMRSWGGAGRPNVVRSLAASDPSLSAS